MLKLLLWAPFVFWALAGASATLQLKDKASVSGKILAEKPDEIVIDIGYTVLVIPRSQIVAMANASNVTEETAAAVKVVAPPPVSAVPTGVSSQPAGQHGFYWTQAVLPRERSVRELVSEVGEAVVQVRTPAGLGSGFFINEDGFLITNFHVTEGETQISVEVYQQRNGEMERKIYKHIRIVALNKFADLALLKVEDKEAPKFVYASLGDSDALSVGERVFAVGSPMGLERTVTEGIVSTKTRQIQGELYLQTTAQINPGNSGGPLFNLRGQVVGVTNMKISFGEGLGFAIPVESVKYFLEHRLSYAYDNDNPSNPYRYLEPPSRGKKLATEGAAR